MIFFTVLFGGIYLVMKRSPFILSAYLTAKLGVKTYVDSIDFHPQGFTVNNFKIRNPKGTKLPYALKIEHLNISTPWISWFRYDIDINLVSLDSTYVSILFPRKKKVACNWIRIFKSLQNELEINRVEPIIQRKIEVQSLQVTNLTVDLHSPGKNVNTIGPIKQILDNNLDLGTKASMKAFTEAIVHEMIMQILSLSIVKIAIESVIELPFEIFSFILKPFKSSGPDDADPCDEVFKYNIDHDTPQPPPIDDPNAPPKWHSQ